MAEWGLSLSETAARERKVTSTRPFAVVETPAGPRGCGWLRAANVAGVRGAAMRKRKSLSAIMASVLV